MRMIRGETYRIVKKLSFSLEQVCIKLIERPHILGICGIGVKIESLPKFNFRLFLEFYYIKLCLPILCSKNLDVPCYLTRMK